MKCHLESMRTAAHTIKWSHKWKQLALWTEVNRDQKTKKKKKKGMEGWQKAHLTLIYGDIKDTSFAIT